MSVSTGDIGFDLTPKNVVIFAVGSTCLLFFLIIYNTFGTFSPVKARGMYKKHQKLSEEYKHLFKTRENLTFHISWAKARGEQGNDATRGMMKDLIKLDEEIDTLEKHMKAVAREMQK
jgi:hypothetical protein